MGSALALYLGLTTLGKVTIAVLIPFLVELSSFIGATVKAVWGRKILLYL